MNTLSQRIFDEYQVRKTRKQKTRFIEMMQREIPGLRVEQGGLSRSRNLIVGDPDSARVLITAHYDTCAQLPFPNLIMPKNMAVTLLYGVLIALPFIGLMLLTLWLLSLTKIPEENHSLIAMLVYLASFVGVFFLGRPNPHTANDNTSGVILLTELLPDLPADAALIFFDNEENGLLGSSLYKKKHREAVKNQLLINADCIGDGENILLVLSKKAREAYGPAFERAFAADTGKQLHIADSKKAYYPSDQKHFPVSAAIAALKKGKLGLYMNRIHTKNDVICDETNVEYVKTAILNLLSDFNKEASA